MDEENGANISSIGKLLKSEGELSDDDDDGGKTVLIHELDVFLIITNE